MLLALLAHLPAAACSLLAPPELAVDPTLEDDAPPAPPAVIDVAVHRGRGPRSLGGGRMSSSSCDDLGSIDITVARPEGDPDGEDVVGYRFALIDGTLPDELQLPRADAAPWLGPSLSLSWIDGATDHQEPFDATIALYPVDVAGNEGEPVEVHIADDGKADPLGTGCATAPGSGLGALPLPLALLALRRRRR